MKKSGVGLVGLLALAGVVGCGGEDGDAVSGGDVDVFFAVDNADVLARAALPTPSDLGAGWEVAGRDEFDDGGDADFEVLMEGVPACASLSALAGIGGLFGSSDEEEVPAGRANVQMVSAKPGAALPTEAEFEVEIEETVAEVQGGWNLVKELIGGEDFEDCMLAVMPKAFSEEDLPEGASIEITSRRPSAQAPNDGVTMSFDISMDLDVVQFDMAVEMYMWPYGNAKATATFVGDQNALDADMIGPSLVAFEQNLNDAA